MGKKLITLITVFISTIVTMSGSICPVTSAEIKLAENSTNMLNIYFYSHGRISKLLKKSLGLHDNQIILDLKRNFDGTSLYLQHKPEYTEESIITVLASKGDIYNIQSPGRNVFLNSDNIPIAWSNDLGNGIFFKDGVFRKPQKNGRINFDPSGKYCSIKSSGLTEIASTSAPNDILISTKLDVRNIFYNNQKIYIFDYDSEYYQEHKKQEKIICQIFKRVEKEFRFEDQIFIIRPTKRSSPFVVVDMDPYSENVLIKDVVDLPFAFLSSYYLFKIKTQELVKIDHSIVEYAYFLKSDIIEELETGGKGAHLEQ